MTADLILLPGGRPAALASVSQALNLLGSAHGHDHANADGRNVQRQLEMLAAALEHPELFDLDEWADAEGICLTHGQWVCQYEANRPGCIECAMERAS